MMNTGYIHINEHSVFILPFNGEIWMTVAQIADLFGVFTSAITANIKSIFKNGILDESEVCHAYSTSDRITYLYNLEMIIALSYRLRSRKAGFFREWVHDRISFPLIVPEMGFRSEIAN
jgi:hypothetical protein